MSRFIHYYAECHNAECRYAECCYAECRYAECRGAPLGIRFICNFYKQGAYIHKLQITLWHNLIRNFLAPTSLNCGHPQNQHYSLLKLALEGYRVPGRPSDG
jgi:hypothetical protein